MDKKDNFKKFIAGIFFLLLLGLTGFVIMVIGIEKGFSQPKFTVTALFHRVDGLAVGAPIRLSGVNVGVVGKIEFLEDKLNGRGVAVAMNIFKKYQRQIEKSTQVAIKTEGVLGGKLVEFSSDAKGPLLDLNFPVEGQDPIDVQDLYGVFTDAATTFNRTYTMMESMMQEFQGFSRPARRLMDRLEEKVMEGNLFKVF